MASESAVFDAFWHRAAGKMMLVSAFGIVAAMLLGGWRGALAFAVGACGSYFNFTWLHRAVEAIGPNARPTRPRVFVFVSLRYLILGAGGYVIVKVFGMNAIAVLSGLFVPVAAILLEALYELIHGT